jgi:hypothetical protein
MKVGLFGGGWEDYIAPVDDYFDETIRNVGNRSADDQSPYGQSAYGFGTDAIPPMMTGAAGGGSGPQGRTLVGHRRRRDLP